jgi:hypothetical protein
VIVTKEMAMAQGCKSLVGQVETLKKAAFLHDLGKLLNWSGALHPLESGRILKYLGYDETIIGVALYHHRRHQASIEGWINGTSDCSGLKPRGDYDEYALPMGRLVDQLMTGFDRLGDGEMRRTRPIVLRNPLTHLPLNGQLRQFEDIINRDDCSGVDGQYLREWVLSRHLQGASLKPLDADSSKCVYVLDEDLTKAPLLKQLAEHKDENFNTLYRVLRRNADWQTLTRRYIPQGHHPPTDTLALWYHCQFSSALMGLYYLEGVRTSEAVHDERRRLKNEPLSLKIGLLYVRLAGLTEYFNGAYRLPDFSGTQAIGDALKEAVRGQLLEAHTDEGLPLVWEDGFLYEGHDDFLVMVPVNILGTDEGEYVFQVDEGDPFRQKWEAALGTEVVLRRAARALMGHSKVRRILAVEPDDAEAFGDGNRLVTNLEGLIRVETAVRCFAGFQDGSELTPRYGMVWNQLRAEAVTRLRRQGEDITYFAGDVCDSCRANLAGRNPDPAHLREWADMDWKREIIHEEDWGDQSLRYWIFRSTSAQPGEGDKLCHACLLRRMLGHGTSLERIAGERSETEDEQEARIAVIKGNVNRTRWFIGGSVQATAPLTNADSTYARVWEQELARNLFERSRATGGSLGEALRRLQEQADRATPEGSGATRMRIEIPLDMSVMGLGRLSPSVISHFLTRPASGNPRKDLVVAHCHYHPQQNRWQRLDDALTNLYASSPDTNWLAEAQAVLDAQPLPDSWLDELWTNYPHNPWAPYSLGKALDEFILWLFSGTPQFARDNEDLPTPSRTMTVSQLIQDAVAKVQPLVNAKIPERWRPVVYAAGDEFLVICRARDAPVLARSIFRTVVAHLNSVPEDWVEALAGYLPVTLAMGMVAAKRKHPMYGLLELVDQLVSNAKAAYPNQSAIDFENVVGGIDEVNLDRSQYDRLWLSRRPLTLSGFAQLMEDVATLQRDEQAFSQRQLQQVGALTVHIPSDVTPETEIAYASRRAAALAYVLQQEPNEGWEIVRRACEDGAFQDLWGLYRWPRSEEENT